MILANIINHSEWVSDFKPPARYAAPTASKHGESLGVGTGVMID